jgi:hypothetical protein
VAQTFPRARLAYIPAKQRYGRLSDCDVAGKFRESQHRESAYHVLIMETKRKPVLPGRTARAEAEELDALNMQMGRKANAVRIIEASIEAKAKKRRAKEGPLPSPSKQAG